MKPKIHVTEQFHLSRLALPDTASVYGYTATVAVNLGTHGSYKTTIKMRNGMTLGDMIQPVVSSGEEKGITVRTVHFLYAEMETTA